MAMQILSCHYQQRVRENHEGKDRYLRLASAALIPSPMNELPEN
jgi:hypothetical protein